MSKELEKVKSQLSKWYPNIYHKVYVDGKIYKGAKGAMCRDTLQRINSININPYKMRMLDIGCNMGGMLWPFRMFYSEAVGIEKSSAHVDFCNNLAKVYDAQDKTRFFNYNLENGLQEFDYLGWFNVIFLLSMTQHLSNWDKIINWCHEHCNLLVIEFNGQPQDIEKYKEYMQTLRKIDYFCKDGYRFTYLAYKPIKFNFDGIEYNTYYHSKGVNCHVYRDPEKDVVIKVYKNKSYEKELSICNELKITPDIIYGDDKKLVMVQEFAGSKLTYYNAPGDYIQQIEDIKKELIKYKYDGVDSQLFVKNNKLKVIDVSAWQKSDNLNVTYNVQIQNVGMRIKQFYNGEILGGKTDE